MSESHDREQANTPREKGNALESAVAAIEATILGSSPGLREKTFVIESKKIVKVGNVHHEIDIYVTIDLGRGEVWNPHPAIAERSGLMGTRT